MYDEKTLVGAQVEVAKQTNMVGYLEELSAKVSPGGMSAAEIEQRKKEVVAKLAELKANCGALLDLIGKAEEVANLREAGKFNRDYLEEEYGVS